MACLTFCPALVAEEWEPTAGRVKINRNPIFCPSVKYFFFRIFRLRLYKGTNTRIRPYLVRDSELDIDPRIMTPGNANAMMLRSLYVNFANRPFCPYSYLLEYDSLPLYAKEVCDQEWKIFKKNDLSCKNITKYCLPEPWMWLNSNQHGSDIARNDHQRDHIKL